MPKQDDTMPTKVEGTSLSSNQQASVLPDENIATSNTDNGANKPTNENQKQEEHDCEPDGGEMPMSMKEAVEAARYLNDILSSYMPHPYKYEGSSKDKRVKELVSRTVNLVNKWLQNFCTKNAELNDLDLGNLDKIIFQTKSWYPGLELPSLKANLSDGEKFKSEAQNRLFDDLDVLADEIKMMAINNTTQSNIVALESSNEGAEEKSSSQKSILAALVPLKQAASEPNASLKPLIPLPKAKSSPINSHPVKNSPAAKKAARKKKPINNSEALTR